MRKKLLECLWSLSKRRQLFHSEADFQHELAWELRASGCANHIRLERPFYINGEPTINLDLLATTDEDKTAIELKYWKKGVELRDANETFHLKHGGAHDVCRYDFWKDVTRLETLVKNQEVDRGFVIALTNDSTYWRTGQAGTVDEDFRIHEGRLVANELKWSEKASDGTKKGREEVLRLRGSYTIKWQSYSTPKPEVEFRLLMVEV